MSTSPPPEIPFPPPLDQPNRCVHTNKRGTRCGNKPMPHSVVCEFHASRNDLACAEEIVGNQELLDTFEGIHEMLSRSARALANGEIDPKRAYALAYLANSMIANLRHVMMERKAIFRYDKQEALKRKALFTTQYDNIADRGF